MSPPGEPWCSHVRLVLTHPHNSSHAMPPRELPCCWALSTQTTACLPQGTFKWLHRHLVWPDLQLTGWQAACCSGCHPSPSRSAIQTLKTSPSSTQVPSGQHPCPAAGILPALSPIFSNIWYLKTDSYDYTNSLLLGGGKYYLKVTLVDSVWTLWL